MERPRVLMLHGYGQTLETFREKTGAIRRVLGSHCELIYIQGAHSVTNFKGETGYAWWTFENEAEFFTATSYQGVEASIELIRRELPFDGIVGFSQGGAFASFLSGLFPLKFSILIGAYPVTDPTCRKHYKKDSTRYLHVYGEQDSIVLPERSKILHELLGGEIVAHPGRHVIPRLKEYRNVLS